MVQRPKFYLQNLNPVYKNRLRHKSKGKKDTNLVGVRE